MIPFFRQTARRTRLSRLGPGAVVSVGVAVLAVAAGAPVQAANEQRVTPSPETQTRSAGAAVQIDVQYTTSNANPRLTGLGLRIHFDSTKLTYAAPSNVLATGLLGLQEPQPDTSNADGDSSTDRFFLVSWADIAGNWPGAVPLRLLTLNFTTAPAFSGSTTVRFSASSTAAGYGFASTPATITASSSPPVGPPISEAGTHLYVIPTCAHIRGVGTTSWVSDVVLHNPGGTPATVNLYLLKRDVDNRDVRGKTLTLAAGTSHRLADVVLATFLESSAAGAILVGSSQPLIVSSRTYNNAPEGTYGQYVAGLAVSRAVSGTAGARLIQLTKTAAYRTNLGLANATASTTPVRATFYRADGSLLGQRDYSLQPYGTLQETDVIGKLTTAEVGDAYAVVASTSATARYFVYASVIDSRTGDPVTILPPSMLAAGAALSPDAVFGAATAKPQLPGAGPAHRDQLEPQPVTAVLPARGHSPLKDLPTAAATHQALLSDGFEGPFPGQWTPWTSQNAPNTAWGRSTYRHWSGSASAWCAAGGAHPSAPGTSYVANMNTWLIYGPFSLADATAARATFRYWLQSEQEWTVGSTTYGDPFMWLVSVDGEHFSGFKTSGDSGGWALREFDFATVSNPQVLGAPQVWFALAFKSDSSIEFEGVYVDEVLIEKTTSGGCVAPAAPALSAPATAASGVPFTVSWSATSPDNSYDLEEASDPNFTSPTRVAVTGCSWSITKTVASATTFHFRVRATRACPGGAVASPWSGSAQTTVSPSAPPVTANPLWVPGTAALVGASGSNWKTDLEIHNAGTAHAEFTVALFRRGETTTSPPTKTLSLDPGRSVRYANALQTLFAFSGAATLRVTSASADIVATSRTYNDQPQGTYGQFTPGFPESAAVAYGSSARLVQLAQSRESNLGFRTNLGLCNLTASAVSVEVTLHTGSGEVLGTRTYTLRAFESIQRDKVFQEVSNTAIDDGFAVVRTTTPGGLVLAFASVIDNRSNDPIFIPAR